MTACTDPPDMCSGGTLTRVVPTCSAASGCGSTTQSPTSCPDTASACVGSAASGNLTLQTYTPACANSTSCGSATRTDTACTTALYTCDGLVFNAWEPTCNATTESCGRRNLRAVDCTRNTRTCELPATSRFYQVRIETGNCSTTGGCGVATTYENCRRGGECVSATRLRLYPGTSCSAGNCGFTDITCNDIRCDDNPDLYRNIFTQTGCSGGNCTETMSLCGPTQYCSDPDGRGGTPARCLTLG